MSRLTNFIPFMAIVLFSIFMGSLLSHNSQINHSNKLGKNLAQYQELITSSDKPLLLHVFATWCKTCKYDLAVLSDKEIQEKYEIVGLLWQDSEDRLSYFLEKNKGIYTSIIVNPDTKLSMDLGIIGVPETFIFDKRGTIIYNHIGTISKKEVLNVAAQKP